MSKLEINVREQVGFGFEASVLSDGECIWSQMYASEHAARTFAEEYILPLPNEAMGTLYNHRNAQPLRHATKAERDASVSTRNGFVQTEIIRVDGVNCYVN